MQFDVNKNTLNIQFILSSSVQQFREHSNLEMERGGDREGQSLTGDGYSAKT